MFNNTTHSTDNQPLSGIINTLDTLENTISNLELDVRNELNTQRLLYRCQLNLAGKCPSVEQVQSRDTDRDISNGAGSIVSKYGKCNCRCNQALGIYLDQLRQSQLEQEQLLQTLKMKEEQTQLYRSKLMETNAIVEHQNQEIQALKDNEELVTKKINTALEQENQTLMNEIDRLKRLPDELRVREHALKVANKELQETKLTLKSLLLDIESGLETCEDISGELQQERKRAFHTLNEIDEEKRKAMNWVAKYSELKQQYDSAVQQKESVQQLSAALREKTIKLDALSKEYKALEKESVDFISNVETVNEKKRTELQARVLELECENLRLKIALEDQCHNTSEVTHNMQRELLNLEKKFVEAHGEINTLKRYNETAAAHAEYAIRHKSLPGIESSAESQSLSPPYCNTCVTEDTSEKLESNREVSSDSFSSARENNEQGSSSGNSGRTTDGKTE
ncbi:protein Daple-like [Ochlerotatus camptorhynchus]|uniref:protein Daple-like n=1 Tax=Ochlerotatus camptorhynchus TaxID=644619 RepID=UPI0031DB4711